MTATSVSSPPAPDPTSLVVRALLLDRAPPDVGVDGTWHALTKPGLRGRERWRWELREAGRAAGRVLFVKKYARCSWREQWDRIGRQTAWHSRAWWEFTTCARLAEAYVPVPRAVGVAESMRGPWERRSVVVLEAAPGDAFERVWPRACAAGARVTRGLARHDIVIRLARLVSAFHQTGMCHRDLYLCHVFVDLDFEGGRPPAFTLIDLARAFRPWWRRMRWIIKDLAQLDSSARQIGASRTDRLRFLHTYLGLQRGALRVRWYARRIVRKSDGILRRRARRSLRS